MVDDITDSVLATSARTRVQALAAQAGLVPGTIGVEDALWPAAGVGITVEFGEASTGTGVALGIGTTWRRIAGIDILICWMG